MFRRKSSKSSASPSSKGSHRRAASTGSAATMGSAPRLFVSPPSLLRKTSRNDQRVRKAPCAVPVVDDATISVGHQQQHSQPKAVGFFVNPPSFRIDQAPGQDHQQHQQQTLGVPMMGTCSDFYHTPVSKQLAKPSGPRRIVSTGSASASSSKGSALLVNPPVFAAGAAGGGRIRKTWGVPMV